MDRALDLATVRGGTATRCGIVAAADLHHVARIVLYHVGAGDEVGVAQPHFAPWRQTEVLLRRILEEVALLDVEHAREGNLAFSRALVLGVVDRVQFVGLAFGVVLDHHAQRTQYAHHAGRGLVQLFPDGKLQLCDVHEAVPLGQTDAGAELPDGPRRVAASAQAAQCGHARIVPAAHMVVLHQLQQLALAQHGVGQVESRELDLLRVALDVGVVQHPVVERTVVFELQRAQRVGDALEGVGQTVREVVHRVDAPRIARAMVRDAPDAIKGRVAQIEVGRGHVDLGP